MEIYPHFSNDKLPDHPCQYPMTLIFYFLAQKFLAVA